METTKVVRCASSSSLILFHSFFLTQVQKNPQIVTLKHKNNNTLTAKSHRKSKTHTQNLAYWTVAACDIMHNGIHNSGGVIPNVMTSGTFNFCASAVFL